MSCACLAAVRRVGRSVLAALLLGPLLLHGALCLARTAAEPELPVPSADVPVLAVTLPNTDGSGLLARPPAFSPLEQAQIFAAGQVACALSCVTKYGTVLGAADGTVGLSNCASPCIRPNSAYLDLDTGEVSLQAQDAKKPNLRYSGIAYQCVEYARRWWMKNLGIAFGDVDRAIDIIYLTQAEQIGGGGSIELARSINGTARRPPRRGDLIVYYQDRDNPDWRFGHVAVVVGVDLDQGIVSVAEQNYSNAPWQDAEHYARQIRLFDIGGRYTLVDVPITSVSNPDGGRVAGWIYPLSAR